MKNINEHLIPLYAENGVLHSVAISPELWEKTKHLVLPIFERQFEPDEKPEPMKDWNTLLEFWDFQYPVDMDVSCEHCGNSTEDWSKDEPRRFRLSAANLGGLVAFQCQKCRSKIIKRHFKREIQVECQPYQECKDQTIEAKHSR